MQAPRCKDLPEMNWWNYGPLYQIGDVKAFSDSQNLKGTFTQAEGTEFVGALKYGSLENGGNDEGGGGCRRVVLITGMSSVHVSAWLNLLKHLV